MDETPPPISRVHVRDWLNCFFRTSPTAFSSLAMGLGILEDTHLEHVPGTAPLVEVLQDGERDKLGGISHKPPF